MDAPGRPCDGLALIWHRLAQDAASRPSWPDPHPEPIDRGDAIITLTHLLTSAAGLGIALLFLLLARRRSAAMRFAADIASLCSVSVALWYAGASPLLSSQVSRTDPTSLGLDGLAVGWWLFGCRAAVSLSRAFFGHDKRSREMRLFSDLIAVAIYVAAALVVLGLVFKLPIGGLLATSGLLAIVLGLALQNTLADVFSGIAVGIEQPFRVGDRTKLSDGVEGRVEQMNWRSIRLRINQDDLAVIPNSTIAKAEIVNRSSPSERGTVRAEFHASADADPDRVFDMLRMATMLAPDVLPEPEPTMLLLRVGERTNGYAINFTVSDTAHAARARSDVLRHARKQMGANGMLPGSSAACGGRLLREAVLFESLDEKQFDALERALRLRRLSAGEVMFDQGDAEAILYLVAGGVIEVTRTIDGSHEALGRIGAGEYIGEIGLLTGTPRVARTTALTDARVYLLDKKALDPLLAGSEDLAHAFEQSALRGRRLYARNPGAVKSEEVGRGELLARIRHFFHRPGS